MNWIKSNPVFAGAIAAALVLLGIALITGFFSHQTAKEERHDNAMVTIGGQSEIIKSNEETINAVQNAQRPATANELQRVCDAYDRNCHPHRP